MAPYVKLLKLLMHNMKAESMNILDTKNVSAIKHILNLKQCTFKVTILKLKTYKMNYSTAAVCTQEN